MRETRIFFSIKQVRDGVVTNLWRAFVFPFTLRAILRQHGVEYASIIRVVGVFRGSYEPSRCLIIFGIGEQAVVASARTLRAALHQDCTMYTYADAEPQFVYK